MRHRRSFFLSVVPRWLIVTESMLALLTGALEALLLAIVVTVAGALSRSDVRDSVQLHPLDVEVTLGVLVAVGLVLTAVRLGLSLLVSWLAARAAARAQTALRKEIIGAFLHSSWSAQMQESEGALQELVVGYAQRVGMSVNFLLVGLAAAANLVALTAAAFTVAPLAAALTAILGTVIAVALRPLGRMARQKAIALADTELGFAEVVHETTRLSQEISVFGVQATRRKGLEAATDDIGRSLAGQKALSGLMSSIYQSIALAFVLVGLGALYLAGATNVASLGAAVLMLIRSLSYAQTAHHARQGVIDLSPYYDAIIEARDRLNARRPPSGTRELQHIDRIELEDVHFSYPGRPPVLRGVTCTIATKEAVAVVGGSGEGKSTLVQVLLRLTVPGEGSYRVNGVAAEEYDSADWTRRVAYVPQSPQLLAASVRENIRFFRELDDAAVEAAARAAWIYDEIEALPNGFDTVIGHRRDALSGGQQQRVALARALAGNPDVLILDEPTSALDPVSEAAVHASLAALRGRVTMVVVAHRPESVKLCDRVLRVHDGQVSEIDRMLLLSSTQGRLDDEL